MQKDFTLNLCATLAHTLLLESKELEPLGIAWVLAGDPPAPTAMETTAEMMAAMEKYLPGVSAAIRKEIVPQELEQLKGAQAVSPGYAKLGVDIYDTEGRRANKVGEEIAASNQMAKANSDAATLAGPGMDLVRNANEAQKIVDPEFFKMKEATGRVGTGIINSFGDDPAKLSGSEREEVSRGIAQQNDARGTASSPSQINTVSNAMQFGNASNQRRANAAGVIGSLAPAMTSTRSGVDVLQQAIGRPGTINTGDARATGAREAGAASMGLGQNLMGQIGQGQQNSATINSQRRSAFDVVNSGISSLGSCCFIFLEVNNGTLPWWVRTARDMHYEMNPSVARGYKRMAKWLVPLMQRSELVKGLVNELMVMPLTAHGGYLMSVEGYSDGRKYEGYKNFWFRIWKYLGK